MKYLGFFLIVVLVVSLFLVVALAAPRPPQAPAVNAYAVAALANRDNVRVRLLNRERPLPVPEVAYLNRGDGVDVDEKGRAILHFPGDALTVEVLRDGALTMGEFTFTGEEIVADIKEKNGTFFNELTVEEAIQARLRVESDFAVIMAVGTRFLVVSEAHTPLDWVVALEAGPQDLFVGASSHSQRRVLEAGQAVWVAPIGAPGQVFEADIDGVKAWLARQQAGLPVEELGEIVWAPASALVDTSTLPDPLPVNAPFLLNGVELRLAPGGAYERVDCNGDGTADLGVHNGIIQFRINPLRARVRALDAQIINYAEPRSAVLQAYNPAGRVAPLERAYGSVGAGGQEVLSVRSEKQPYHYADLSMQHGCFLNMSLGVPPQVAPTPTPTPTQVTAVPPTLPPTPTSWPLATLVPPPTTTPLPTPTPCVPSPPAGWLPYTVQPGDTFYGLSRLTGASMAQIQQANCAFDGLFYGEVIWLPPFPTVTPSPSPSPTATTPAPPPSLALVLQSPQDGALLPCIQGDAPLEGELVQRISATEVNLSWRPAAADAAIAAYRVTLNVAGPDGAQFGESRETPALSLPLTLPCNVGAVSWSVQAVGMDGRLGPIAGPATFRIEYTPPIPAPMIIAPQNEIHYTCDEGQRSVNVPLSWQPPRTDANIAFYEIELSVNDSASETITEAARLASQVSTSREFACGSRAGWRVRAIADSGQVGEWTSLHTFWLERPPVTQPPRPPVAIAPGTPYEQDPGGAECRGWVELSWQAVEDESGIALYVVSVETRGKDSWIPESELRAEETAVSFGSLREDTAYRWRVYAVNRNDISGEPSNWLYFKTPRCSQKEVE